MERLIHNQIQVISEQIAEIKQLENKKSCLLSEALEVQLQINRRELELHILQTEVNTLRDKFPANESLDGQSVIYQHSNTNYFQEINQAPFKPDYQQ